MPFVVYLLALALAPDPNRLGHPDWRVREAESGRCAHPLAAALAPASDPDPEADARLRALRQKHLRWLDARWVERVVYRDHFAAWMRLYFAPGRSGLEHEYETFLDLHNSHAKATAVLAAAPPPDGYSGFLLGAVCPGEYERWLDHLDYHRGRAPHPRER